MAFVQQLEFSRPTTVSPDNPWRVVPDGDPAASALFARHYTARPFRRAGGRGKFIGPGYSLVLLTLDALALFGWRKFRSMDDQTGVNCAVFRNEAPKRYRSSRLILQAEEYAAIRWPGERAYTYVDPGRVASRNPGYCFLRAGWRRCGQTQGGLLVLEKDLTP